MEFGGSSESPSFQAIVFFYKRVNKTKLCFKACNGGGAPVRAMTHLDSFKFYSPENAIIKGKSRIQETLTLTMCADNSIVSKTNRNIWVLFGTPPRL